jgi:hypothetical protein
MMARSIEEYPSFKKLREYCEALELAANFIQENTPQKIRVAFILLHNIAELLMYRIAERAFDHDEYISKVITPKFSRTLKKKVRREFTEQIRFVVSQGVLSEEEGLTLQIAHAYRTPAFHRDDHNPNALQALAFLLYSPIATLFEKASNGRGSSCTEEEKAWLERYGVSCDWIPMYDDVSVAIVTTIRSKIPLDFEGARSVLCDDLDERIAVAESKMSTDDELGSMVTDWPVALSESMFWSSFDEQAVGADYWALRWKIGAGENVSQEEYFKAEEDFNTEKLGQKAAFVPPFELRQLPELKDKVEALKSTTNPSRLAAEYHEIDEKLMLLEDAIEDIHTSVDAAIQHAIDVARGK